MANLRTARMHIEKYRAGSKIDDIDDGWVIGLVSFLVQKRGLKNSSIDKTLRLLKCFLRWASKSGIYSKDYRQFFELRLKGVDSNRSDLYLQGRCSARFTPWS